MTSRYPGLVAALRGLVAAVFLSALAQDAATAQSILGRWHGTSTCVVAEWNRACNNEQVIYDFVPAPPDANHVILHAAKLVGDQPESMGDLAFNYSPTPGTWDSDFANERVRIRWTFLVRGDTLVGELTILPTLQIARHVVASRDADVH